MNLPPPLTFDEIDDCLYFTRTDSLSDLETALSELTQKYTCTLPVLLAACADPETQNSIFHYASANGLLALLQKLLSLLSTSSDPDAAAAPATIPHLLNVRNNEGNTPLHWAAYNGHLEVVKLLMASGADMWVKNAAGHLAMFEAERAERTEVVQFLLEAGGTEVERVGSVGKPSEEDLAEVEAEVDEEVVRNGESAGGPSG